MQKKCFLTLGCQSRALRTLENFLTQWTDNSQFGGRSSVKRVGSRSWTSDGNVSTPGNTGCSRTTRKENASLARKSRQLPRQPPAFSLQLRRAVRHPSLHTDGWTTAGQLTSSNSQPQTWRSRLLHLPAKGLGFQQPSFSSPELILASLVLRGRTEIVC